MPSENYGTIWVCQNCLMHHANGECGCCHEEPPHPGEGEQEPLSAIEWPFTVTMGMMWEEHDPNCPNWPEGTSNNVECDCGTNTYSTSQCEGCSTYLHGERHAMTLWKEE